MERDLTKIRQEKQVKQPTGRDLSVCIGNWCECILMYWAHVRQRDQYEERIGRISHLLIFLKVVLVVNVEISQSLSQEHCWKHLGICDFYVTIFVPSNTLWGVLLSL